MPYAHAITSFVGLQSHEVVRWKRHHKSWIELWLAYRGRIYRCGRCGKGFDPRHDEEPIRIRDLDIGKHRVFLWLPRYRVRCPRCGIRRVKSVTPLLGRSPPQEPWAQPGDYRVWLEF